MRERKRSMIDRIFEKENGNEAAAATILLSLSYDRIYRSGFIKRSIDLLIYRVNFGYNLSVLKKSKAVLDFGI